ncbi:MAG: metallophosphoesterase [Rikenellaceae bacterium]|nr:metallophosphoesterase [Rikenellaceae bacterium]
MRKLPFIALLLLCVCGCSEKPQREPLRFRDDGTFTVLHFTDLHWSENSGAGCYHTRTVVREVVICEQPDLIILTGDIVVDPPAREGWQSIIEMLAATGVPWAVTMGNHDTETGEGISKEDIFGWLEKSPAYIGTIGPRYITGSGNFDLQVLSCAGDRTAAVIYCFDSNEYTPDTAPGKYDWIHSDQIDWYASLSRGHTAEAGGPLPSLAFMHIPLPEYRTMAENCTTFGNMHEGVSSAEINSGLFSRMVECGDVMGIFCGHDHNNDYIGILHGVALAFGRVTGGDAYGFLPRGARAIKLYEGRRRFDTWLTTPGVMEPVWYYPIGFTSYDEKYGEYLPGLDTAANGNGLRYRYYEGSRFKHTDDIAGARLIGEGTAANFSLDPILREDSLALVFEGLIDIPEKGLYRFHTVSDDGSVLSIDHHPVVDNDGSHDRRRREGTVGLDAGLHRIELKYFQDYMGKVLEVGIASRERAPGPIPDSMLFLSSTKEPYRPD